MPAMSADCLREPAINVQVSFGAWTLQFMKSESPRRVDFGVGKMFLQGRFRKAGGIVNAGLVKPLKVDMPGRLGL